jgi:PAS domain S-box-containing protein
MGSTGEGASTGVPMRAGLAIAGDEDGPGSRAPGVAHGVVFHERDDALLDELQRFVRGALVAGEAALVVATRAHLAALSARLGGELAEAGGRYLALEAEEALARILEHDTPDAARFAAVIGAPVERAAREHGRVHAFGEMVALLWTRGDPEGALRLEGLWNDLARRQPVSVLCAYPYAAVVDARHAAALLRVCAAHSHVLTGDAFTSLDTRLRESADLAQATSALAVERARLAAIVDSSDDAIVSKTLDGVVTSWNAGAERVFGYTAEEMVGQPIARVIPPDCRDDLITILSAIRRGERVDHYDTERIRKDGRRIHVSLTVSPIKDASGTIVGASKIARDISPRKDDEEELRRQRETIDTLYQVGLTLAAELDLEKLLQAVTDAATRLTGATYGAFLSEAAGEGGARPRLRALSGAPRAEVEELSARYTALLAPTFAGERAVRLDDVTRDPRCGRNVPSGGTPSEHPPVRSYLAAPIVGRGGAVFGALLLGHPAAGVFTDRAERIVSGLAAHAAVAIDNARLYEAERGLRADAEAASRAKDEFLAMLGHELRNPLSAIRNAVITASLDVGGRDRSLGIIRRGADQLTRLVDDLLDVARVTHGKISLRRERVRLAGVVERSAEATRPLLDERAHQLELSLPSEPLDVDGDQTRLEQVLVNLISNSAKYTERGGRIEISLRRSGDEAVVRVRDNGTGISAEMLPRVFDLFAQAGRGLDRAPSGLGIGLTVVRRLVELHGGRVEVHSEGVGRGAEFVVRLPALAPRPERAAPSAPAPAPAPSRRARVMLVEDNRDAAESMQMLLELLGHEVHVAHDGAAALPLALVHRPDVMLVDIGLPGVDGYEVARRVRGEPSLASTVLVAVTGYGRAEDKQRAVAAGFDRHLTKPVEPDALRGLVAALPPDRSGRPPLH